MLQEDPDASQPSVFGRFAKEWFPAILSAVLGSAEQAAEQGIHYLLLDTCLMCLNWHDLFPAVGKTGGALDPQVKLAADSLMDYLVRSVHCVCESAFHDCQSALGLALFRLCLKG